MRKPAKQQTAEYRIREQRNGYAVYDKHSRFRVIYTTAAEAQEYINQHSTRGNRVAIVSTEHSAS